MRPDELPDGAPTRLFALMACGVVLDVLLGIGALFVMPFGRSSSWDPGAGRILYIPHALVGVLLGAGAVASIVAASGATRVVRRTAGLGAGSLLLSGAGGMAAMVHGTRLVGMAAMFIGSAVAFTAYLMPYLTRASMPQDVPGTDQS